MATLREHIDALLALEKLHGGQIQVEKWLPSQGRHAAPLPQLAFVYVAPDRIRSMGPPPPRFWHETDPADRAGDPVIRI